MGTEVLRIEKKLQKKRGKIWLINSQRARNPLNVIKKVSIVIMHV